MFTRAGFNPRHTVVCCARIAVGNAGRTYEARLIRFVPSGDLAWYSRSGSFLVWGDRVQIINRFRLSTPCGNYESILLYHRKLDAARAAGVLREVA